MRKTTFLLFSFLFVFTFSTTAQIVKDKTTRAERRAKNKANQRVDQTIDNAVDDAFNKIGSIFKKKKKKKKKNSDTPPAPESKKSSKNSESGDQEVAGMMEKMLGGSKDLKTADSYTFNTTITMRSYVEKASGKKKDETEMKMMFSNNGNSFGMGGLQSKHDVVMVIDLVNNSMLTINKKDKQAMAFSLDVDDIAAEAEEHNSQATVRKTGRTKTILGYTCAEYVIDDEDHTSTIWITSQLKGFDLSKMPKKFNKSKNNPWQKLGTKNGVMLASKMKEKKKKGKTFNMNATKVDKTTKTYRMADYKVMSLSSMMQGKE